MNGTLRFAAGALLLMLTLAGCKSHAPDQLSPAAKASATTHTAGGPARCHDNAACAASEYCAFDPGLCGKGQSPGTCRSKPSACPSGHDPVCACDGQVYDTECAAHLAGQDLAALGGCPSELPHFATCGAHYCDARQSYCEIYLSDVFELPTDHFCRPLPAACRPRGGVAQKCACFPKDTPCLSFCGPLPTGGIDAFHLTCQGKKPPYAENGEPH